MARVGRYGGYSEAGIRQRTRRTFLREVVCVRATPRPFACEIRLLSSTLVGVIAKGRNWG